MVTKRKRTLSVAFPSSLVSEHKNLREKTKTLGEIARAASIYRVDNILIYRDLPDEYNLIKEILVFIETPQYLRKRLFHKKKELSYVGLLPPLRTPHHPLERRARDLSLLSYREGVVLTNSNTENLVDIGLQQPIVVSGHSPSIGSRVTIQIINKKPLKGKIVRKEDINLYWGYQVLSESLLPDFLNKYNYDLTIATSRNGISYIEIMRDIEKAWKKSKNILLVFGSPRNGIKGILKKQGLFAEFDYYLNMIPDQGTATVRTEEATHATLAILNLLDSYFK